ncbi:MAG: hypothetical protein AAGF56_02675 [Pseudomonadota bacterium]
MSEMLFLFLMFPVPYILAMFASRFAKSRIARWLLIGYASPMLLVTLAVIIIHINCTSGGFGYSCQISTEAFEYRFSVNQILIALVPFFLSPAIAVIAGVFETFRRVKDARSLNRQRLSQ